MDNRFKFRAQRESGEWIYFTLEELATDSRLQAEWKRLKNQTGCIGLKDKNGKLIFEGDILKDFGGNGAVEYCQAVAAFIVSDGKGGNFWLNEGNNKRPTQLQYTEIIGNIYENPEFLNQPK